MRGVLLSFILVMCPSGLLSQGCEIRWPDAEIPVPPLVQSFIGRECVEYDPVQDADWQSCVHGEEYGYSAVVTLLSDVRTGELAAEHYRACQAGLGAQGGRFHRRRAECMGMALGFVWRFEFSRRASIDGQIANFDFAGLAAPKTVPDY